jgi:delta14-sterol reductase
MLQQQQWLESAIVVVLLHASILLIHLICPAFSFDGYVCDVVNIKKPLSYRLNGLACLVISVSVFFLVHYYSLEEGGESVVLFLSRNYMAGAVMSNVLGLVVSFYLVYVRFPSLSKVEQKANAFRRAPTTTLVKKKDDKRTEPTSGGDLDDRSPDFYWGREFTPRYDYFGGTVVLDIKMFLYVTGAVLLELNILSGLLLERYHRGTSSLAMLTYTGLLTWFICEYLYFERIHLYTYDLFAEKVGFKLAWGCLCFYPFPWYSSHQMLRISILRRHKQEASSSSFTVVGC